MDFIIIVLSNTGDLKSSKNTLKELELIITNSWLLSDFERLSLTVSVTDHSPLTFLNLF